MSDTISENNNKKDQFCGTEDRYQEIYSKEINNKEEDKTEEKTIEEEDKKIEETDIEMTTNMKEEDPPLVPGATKDIEVETTIKVDDTITYIQIHQKDRLYKHWYQQPTSETQLHLSP